VPDTSKVKCPHCKADFTPVAFSVIHGPKFGDLALSTFFCSLWIAH
jgi:hypothetical protein